MSGDVQEKLNNTTNHDISRNESSVSFTKKGHAEIESDEEETVLMNSERSERSKTTDL